MAESTARTRLVGYTRAIHGKTGDLAGQVKALAALGVHSGDIYSDWGIAGRPKPQPQRDAAVAAAAAGTLLVTNLARLANSPGDLSSILPTLVAGHTSLQIGPRVLAADQLAQLDDAIDVLGAFDANLQRLRAAERAVTPPPDDRRGLNYSLTELEEDRLVELWTAGHLPADELAGLFGIARSTLFRIASRGSSQQPSRRSQQVPE